MKVICITEERIRSKKDGGLCPAPTGIKKGEIYTIKKTVYDSYGNTGYVLLETYNDNDQKGAYNSRRFAPIQTDYADAKAEILEKFKSPEETPDKVNIPQPINQ